MLFKLCALEDLLKFSSGSAFLKITEVKDLILADMIVENQVVVEKDIIEEYTKI